MEDYFALALSGPQTGSEASKSNREAETLFTLEASVHAAVILTIAVAVIILNTLVISSFTNVKGTGDVLNIYIMSLSVADFVCGVLVVPLSVYPALVHKWIYGDVVCRVVGYIEAITWVVSAYTMMWISVDRYVAIQRPLRYDTVQTKTRCQCWMAFTWISSAMMCSPPLIDIKSDAVFDEDSFICMLNWDSMIAYSATLLVLVLGPSLITIVYTYIYTFHKMRKLRKGDVKYDNKENLTALTEALASPNHSMAFVLIVTFWLAWLPLMCVKGYEKLSGSRLDIPHLHFLIVWIGFSHSAWKAFILITFSPQYRMMLRLLCLTLCCRQKTPQDIELMNLDFDE